MNFPFIWYKNVGRTLVRFVTIHACDGQRDGWTPLRSERPRCIQCSAVKMTNIMSFSEDSNVKCIGAMEFTWNKFQLTYSFSLDWKMADCRIGQRKTRLIMKQWHSEAKRA